MKKDYLRPEAEILDIEVGVIMQDNSPGFNSGIEGGEADDFSNKHRGDWNNIWGEEE